jgi:hypothetical protein
VRLIPHEAKFFETFAELSGYLTEGASSFRAFSRIPRCCQPLGVPTVLCSNATCGRCLWPRNRSNAYSLVG